MCYHKIRYSSIRFWFSIDSIVRNTLRARVEISSHVMPPNIFHNFWSLIEHIETYSNEINGVFIKL